MVLLEARFESLENGHRFGFDIEGSVHVDLLEAA
jgi:hypothetical protein